MNRTARAVLSLALGSLPAAPALAQWSPDSNVNNPVAVTADNQSPVVAVSDGAGGAIFVWRSERFDVGTFTFVYSLRAQRINAGGVTQWTAGGVPLVVDTVSVQATLLRPPFSAVADGSGGAIAAWRDLRNSPDTGEIFAQRVDATGAPLWTVNGVAVAAVADLQQKPVLASDGSGGAIIAWEDRRAGFGNVDVYAQRVTAAGTVSWAANGVPVCNAAADQLLPAVVADGAGGAVIAWGDNRGTDQEIFVQRLTGAGAPVWTANGVALTNVAGIQTRPAIAGSGGGGAVVAWEDARTAADNDIYAQRVSSAGTPMWTADGVQLGNAQNTTAPVIASDGADGAIVAWTDERNGGGNTDVFAQRVSAAGAPQWTMNGVTVCGATGGQFFPALAADGAGGAVIGWEDARSDPNDVFAQRLDPTGAALWAAGGRPVSTAANGQGGVTVAPDGSGGGIFAWADGRLPANGLDVFAAHVDASGGLPVTLETFTIE